MQARRFGLLLAALTLGAAGAGGCGDDGKRNPDENISPVLDGFDSGNAPSPCQGLTVAQGAACSLPQGAFCATTVDCACYPLTRTIACECSGGAWVCPESCANEQPPCPEADVLDDMDAGTDSDVASDVEDDTSAPGDTLDDTGTPDDTSAPDTVAPGASLTASDQTLSQLSTVVTVDEVIGEGAGFVVISASDGVLGHVAVADGVSSAVDVALSRPLSSGESLTARLHVDAGQSGVFEPGTDTVAQGASGPAEAVFVATVAPGTPAARLSVTTPGDAAWDYAPAEPSTVDAVGSEAQNETLTLRRGWRYEVVNASAALSWELVGTGGSVLLSQSGAGLLEADADVAWSESGGTLRFTLAPTLATAVTGYQDAADTSIGGAVVVVD